MTVIDGITMGHAVSTRTYNRRPPLTFASKTHSVVHLRVIHLVEILQSTSSPLGSVRRTAIWRSNADMKIAPET